MQFSTIALLVAAIIGQVTAVPTNEVAEISKRFPEHDILEIAKRNPTLDVVGLLKRQFGGDGEPGANPEPGSGAPPTQPPNPVCVQYGGSCNLGAQCCDQGCLLGLCII